MIKDEDKDDKEQIKELLFASKSNNNIKFEKKKWKHSRKNVCNKEISFSKEIFKNFLHEFFCVFKERILFSKEILKFFKKFVLKGNFKKIVFRNFF